MSLYNTTLSQPFLFAAFLYLGILLGILYSVFRGIRQIFGSRRVILVAADILFLLITAGSLLYALYTFTHLKLRIYHFLGTLLGFGFYSAAIHPLIHYINCKFRKKKIDNSRGE